ncbi:MAG: hypothetical protein AAFZ17_02220 [Cyanobacteria bacterium J06650_10]
MKAYLRLMPVFCLSTLTGCALASSQGKAIRLTAKTQMMRTVWAQKDHYLQHQIFAESVSELAGCVDQIAANYRSTKIEVEGNRTDSYAIATQNNLYETTILGKPYTFPWQRSGNLYSYVGTVYSLRDELSGFDALNRPFSDESSLGLQLINSQLISIVCQANEPGTQQLEPPSFIENRLECAEGSYDVTAMPID